MLGLRLIPFLATGALAIWPLPVSQSTGDGILWIDENVQIYYNGASTVSTVRSVTIAEADLCQGIGFHANLRESDHC